MGGVIVTDKNWDDTALPRLSGESPDVYPGSPLAVIGLWVFALRERFRANTGEPLPWVWADTLRPEDTEDGNPLPDGHPRKLLIDSQYNVKKGERNYRPAIYIGRGGAPVTPIKTILDNKAGVYLPMDMQAHYCQAQMAISMECESADVGESSALGETVWGFILATRDIFRKDFGLHEITEPILGDTTPIKVDKEVWVTPVQFAVSYDVRWGTFPIAPKLREIAGTLSTGYTDATTFFQSFALREIDE